MPQIPGGCYLVKKYGELAVKLKYAWVSNQEPRVSTFSALFHKWLCLRPLQPTKLLGEFEIL